MLVARLVAGRSGNCASYIGTGQQVSTARGIDVTLERLAPLIRDRGRANHLDGLATATPDALMERAACVGTLQRRDGDGGGMDVPTWRLAVMLPRAPEYSLADLRRWLEGANWGRGPMWPDHRSRDLMAEVPEMPVPMRLISGARDLNTPVELAADWFQAVEAPRGKRQLVFAQSVRAPFLTEPERFTDALRRVAERPRSE